MPSYMLSLFSHFRSIRSVARQAPLSMGLSRQNTGVGCHALLQEIVPIQGSNPCLLSLQHWQVGSLLLVLPRKPLGDKKKSLKMFRFTKHTSCTTLKRMYTM